MTHTHHHTRHYSITVVVVETDLLLHEWHYPSNLWCGYATQISGMLKRNLVNIKTHTPVHHQHFRTGKRVFSLINRLISAEKTHLGWVGMEIRKQRLDERLKSFIALDLRDGPVTHQRCCTSKLAHQTSSLHQRRKHMELTTVTGFHHTSHNINICLYE